MDDHKMNEERPKPDTSRQAEIAFRLYDKDKDGYITKSEMEKLSKTLSKVRSWEVGSLISAFFKFFIFEYSALFNIPHFFNFPHFENSHF